MTFMTVAVIADDCASIRRSLDNAEADLAWATAEAVFAELAWVAALAFASANAWNPAAWLAVSLASGYKAFCLEDVLRKSNTVSILKDDLYRCENPPKPIASGNNDSGNCDS